MNLSLIMLMEKHGNIENCLESFLNDIANYEILIGDLGICSEDLKVCRSLKSKIISVPANRASALNLLVSHAKNPCIVHVEPWERLVSGTLSSIENDDLFSFRIIQNGMVTYETRVFSKKNNVKYQNPIFETNGLSGGIPIATIISEPPKTNLEIVRKWAESNPTIPDVHYYLACSLLSHGNINEFVVTAKNYLFMEKNSKSIIQITLIRYYLAIVLMSRDMGESLKLAIACLAANSLMAEFWCLVGDIYFKLRNYSHAIHFYENAMILGSKRLSNDGWPMEISKYKEYPTEKMNLINSNQVH